MNSKLRFYSIYEDGYFHGTMTSLLLDYGFREVSKPEDAEILVFNGGADIATEIYGELPIYRGIPALKTNRDKYEVSLYDDFVGQKFFLGICRGGQLLNCLNGGKLWQHVTDHQRDHQMIDLRTGEQIKVTSTHHQMMRPHRELAEIIGVANISGSREAEVDAKVYKNLPKDIKMGEDIEVVWYPNTRSLCIQGHPEYVPGSRFADWSIELMMEKYNNQTVCNKVA